MPFGIYLLTGINQAQGRIIKRAFIWNEITHDEGILKVYAGKVAERNLPRMFHLAKITCV